MTKLVFALKVALYFTIGILIGRIIGAVVDAQPTFKPVSKPVIVRPVEKTTPVATVPTTAIPPTPVATAKPVPTTPVKTVPTTAPKLVPAQPKVVEQPKPQALAVGDTTLNLINQTRFNLGLQQLRVQNDLMVSASSKCQHMSVNDYWAHTGAGRTSNSWNPRYSGFSEILARGYGGDPWQIHEAWLNSPTHYGAIVLPWTQYFGIGRCTTLTGLDLTVVHMAGN